MIPASVYLTFMFIYALFIISGIIGYSFRKSIFSVIIAQMIVMIIVIVALDFIVIIFGGLY